MPSDHAQRTALVIDDEREKIARIGMSSAATLGWRVRRAALYRYMHGGNPVDAIRREIEIITPGLVDSMVAAHLQGVLRSNVAAEQANKTLELANVYARAIEYIQEKLNLTGRQILTISQKYAPAAARFVDQLSQFLELRVSKAVQEATTNGLHVQGGMKLIREAFDKAGVTPTNSYTIENTYRTQTALAYSAGRIAANAHPDIQEILWGYEYVTVGDDRVRPTHAALDGMRAPKEDPRWNTLTPPNGYSCRCSLIECYHGDELATATPLPMFYHDKEHDIDVPVQPDPGWDFNPATVFGHSLTGVS